MQKRLKKMLGFRDGNNEYLFMIKKVLLNMDIKYDTKQRELIWI